MEDLVGLLMSVIFIAIAAIAKSSTKKQQEAEKRRVVNPESTAPAKWTAQGDQTRQIIRQTMQENREKQGKERQTKSAKQEGQAKPAKQEDRVKPAMPKVHTHLTPECSLDAELSGSMNYDSPEGRDACHEDQLRPVDQPLATHEPEVEKPGMKLDLSPNAMMQAIIMQEVLQRPCQRRRR